MTNRMSPGSVSRGYAIYFMLTVLLLFCLPGAVAAATVTGKVSSSEGGMPNVVVTDGFQCVLTGIDGTFSLVPHQNARFIYISTPAGYLPAEEKMVPRFYIPIDA